MNPDTYDESMTQAEAACFASIAAVLELTPGKDATIAISNGLPDAAVFDIGMMGIGDTNTFPSCAIHYRAALDLFNRNRAALQRWIMRLISTFPVNRWYNPHHEVREDANVVHFRIAPERGAVSVIKPTVVKSSNSGEVPTWTCHIDMDVVFICDPDYVNNEGSEGGEGSGGSSGGGGTTDDPPDLPED